MPWRGVFKAHEDVCLGPPRTVSGRELKVAIERLLHGPGTPDVSYKMIKDCYAASKEIRVKVCFRINCITLSDRYTDPDPPGGAFSSTPYSTGAIEGS